MDEEEKARFMNLFPFEVQGYDLIGYKVVYHSLEKIPLDGDTQIKEMSKQEFESTVKTLIRPYLQEKNQQGITIFLDCRGMSIPKALKFQPFGVRYFEIMENMFPFLPIRVVVYDLPPWMLPLFLLSIPKRWKKNVLAVSEKEPSKIETWMGKEWMQENKI